MSSDGKYISVATKLSTNQVARLKKVMHKIKGCNSIYEMGQAAFGILIHCFDEPSSMSEREQAVFDEFNDVAMNSLHVTDETAELEVNEATYYLCDKSGKKSGAFGALVKRPFFGIPQVSYNHREIIERALCLLFPKIYRQLRKMASMQGAESVIEVISLMLIHETDRMESRQVEEGFQDNERGEYGQKKNEQLYVNSKSTIQNG